MQMRDLPCPKNGFPHERDVKQNSSEYQLPGKAGFSRDTIPLLKLFWRILVWMRSEKYVMTKKPVKQILEGIFYP